MNEQPFSEEEKSNKSQKACFALIWLAVFCLLMFFVWKYFRNAGIIENYNFGNRAFKEKDYDAAKVYYDAALSENPSKNQDCRIRINKALSVTTPITPESVTYDNLDEAIAKLEGARDILTENGCANEADENGHNTKAQILKNEIDEYIKWLRENVKPPEDSDGNSQDGGSDPDKKQDEQNNEEQQSKMDRLQKQMDEVQSKGMEERNRELSDYEDFGKEHDYYDGKNW